MRSPEIRVHLLGKEVTIDWGIDDRKDIIFCFLVSLDLTDVTHKSQTRIVLLDIKALISREFFFEVVSKFKQGEVVIVLLDHQFNDLLLRFVLSFSNPSFFNLFGYHCNDLE